MARTRGAAVPAAEDEESVEVVQMVSPSGRTEEEDNIEDSGSLVPSTEDVDDALGLEGIDMEDDLDDIDSKTGEALVPDFDAPYEKNFNLEDELPLFEKLDEYLDYEEEKDDDDKEKEDPIRAKVAECHRDIQISRLVFKEKWLENLLEDADNAKDESLALKPYHLLLCLVSQGFCRVEAATLRCICKQLDLATAVQTAIKEWELEEEFPITFRQVAGLSDVQSKVWKSILFVARVYYAMKILSAENSSLDEELVAVLMKVLLIIENADDKKHTKHKKKRVRGESSSQKRGGKELKKHLAAADDNHSKKRRVEVKPEKVSSNPKVAGGDPPKRRGRPPKAKPTDSVESEDELSSSEGNSNPPKPRGRPPKAKPADTTESTNSNNNLRTSKRIEAMAKAVDVAATPAARRISNQSAATVTPDARPTATKLGNIRSMLETMLQEEEHRHQQEVERHQTAMKKLKESLAAITELQEGANESEKDVRVEIENEVKKKALQFFSGMGS